MGPFDKATEPRKHREPRRSADNVPLLPVRRRPRHQNVWNDDNEQVAELGDLRRRSSETFYEFLEDEDEEDIGRMTAENGGYHNSEVKGLAKNSFDDPQSVGPGTKPANLSPYFDPTLQNHYCLIFPHRILTQKNRNCLKTIPHMKKSELLSRIQMIQQWPA